MTRTLGSLLDAAVGAAPEKEFLFFRDDVYTFADVARGARGAAGVLSSAGVRRGDRVATLLPNSPSFVFALFGAARLGATLVPVNPALARPEIAVLLGAAAPAAVVSDRARASAAPRDRVAVVLDTDLDGSDGPDTLDVASPDDVAVMLTTSGSTGVPKLVMQTHRALVLAAEGFPWWLGLDETDRLLTALPLFHLNALAYSMLGSIAAGASLVLLPRFSATSFWDEARAYGATEFNAVGAMLEILTRRARRSDDAANPVRLCYTALAPATRERHVEIEDRFGMRVIAGYGLSECPYGTVWPLEGAAPYGSMGRLRQHPTLGEINACRVVDDDGTDVPTGKPGELLLRNPSVMKGYFDNADETEAALRDGWLHTGDVVRRDADGIFYFVTRKKDVIRCRGENIAPQEIEAALEAHSDVVEAAVVAVPSDLGEDDVKVFVVVVAGRTLAPVDLRAWLAERLAPFKVPRYVEFVEELPRTPTGRVAKSDLPRDRTPREVDLD